jgi:hypothetical protein
MNPIRRLLYMEISFIAVVVFWIGLYFGFDHFSFSCRFGNTLGNQKRLLFIDKEQILHL